MSVQTAAAMDRNKEFTCTIGNNTFTVSADFDHSGDLYDYTVYLGVGDNSMGAEIDLEGLSIDYNGTPVPVRDLIENTAREMA